MDSLFINVDDCTPRINLTLSDHAHSDKAALVVFVAAMVLYVLSVGAPSEIAATVVQSISVSVIALLAFRAFQNNSVHGYRAIFGSSAFGIETVFSFTPMCTPIPFREPLKISGIDKRILPLRKRDQSVGYIFWLGNGVPLNSAFRHESSFKGLVQPSHFSMIPAVTG